MGARSGTCTTADQNAVTVAIDYQQLGGGTATYCVTGVSAATTGMQALQDTGLAVTMSSAGFVCRINGKPGATQALPVTGDAGYTEQCAGTPPTAAYWTYWYAKPGGGWTYSSQGAGSHRVNLGGFEGWSFSLNHTMATAPAPGVNPVTPAAPAPAPATTKAGSQPTTAAQQPAAQAPATQKTTTKAQTTTAPAPGTAGETQATDAASPEQTTVTTPIVVSPGTSQASPNAAESPSASDAQAPPPTGGPGAGTLVGLGVLVVLAVAAVVVWRRRARPAHAPQGDGKAGA